MRSKVGSSNISDQMTFMLHVKNFGPVSDAKITLKPLTIFVGPNNSGKSYTAMLIHSIISAYSSKLWYTLYARKDRVDGYERLLSQLTAKNKRAETNDPVTLDSEVDDIAQELIKEIESNIPQQIQRNFNSNLGDIVRINSASFSISMPEPRINIKYEDGQCNFEYKDLALNAKIVFQERKRVVKEQIGADDSRTYIMPTNFHYYEAFKLSDYLYSYIESKLRGRIPRQSHYLPAARSGILQGHKAITASVISGAPYAGIEGTQIPPLSGVAADFISSIIAMPKEVGHFSKYVKDMDYNILDGRITVSNDDKHRLPEIQYEFMNQEIPLHRTSSTVSEMAALVLYLKHIVGKNSLLIVEEPEAHLHPTNQLTLARYIAKLVRAGLNVLITTHSHFILEQVSILLQSSNVDSKTRKKIGLNEDEYLNDDEVSPYLFRQIDKGNHTAEPIECSSIEGISQDDFVRVQETLYEQTISVEQAVSQL